ncbi:hypothetical protein GBA63_07455 [Rubrobacter tropicus]|uniref:Uncharacterized protein n=1 Tax=Rubrobacter tropicus TaxID=2653851 RepID=A0A6G8Q7T8_9ACTN|nr:hypothetical protein [Rubrobacter tropicus]QIN82498.1 hypothetical protein GBA63_07455 [Rubrobacter tropicus]
MSIDKVTKDYKARVKASEAMLNELEARAAEIVEQREYADDARSLIEDVRTGLDSIQADKVSTEAEMLRAMALDDNESLVGLRERYASLAEREQRLQGEIRQLAGVVESNTVNPSELAALITRLKRFNSPSVDDVVKAIRENENSTAQDAQERVTATLELLPTPAPRTTHAALMELDEGYRMNDGATLEKYLRDEDDKGNSEQATAMLAARLEARDRRAVVAARK